MNRDFTPPRVLARNSRQISAVLGGPDSECAPVKKPRKVRVEGLEYRAKAMRYLLSQPHHEATIHDIAVAIGYSGGARSYLINSLWETGHIDLLLGDMVRLTSKGTREARGR